MFESSHNIVNFQEKIEWNSIKIYLCSQCILQWMQSSAKNQT